MKGFSAIALALVLVGCSSSTAPQPSGKTPPGKNPTTTTELKSNPIPEMSGLSLASSITNGNVTIYPVTTKKPSAQEMDDMVTLDEAKRKGWVEIVEREDETVEELEVINKGPKPIFLLAGEVLLGGKQDRIVSKDTIVKPGETVKVPVYCVDQGRWSGGEEFAPTSKFAPSDVRKAAAVEQDQGLVWDKVAESNGAMAGIDVSVSAGNGASLKKSMDSKILQTRQADAEAVTKEIMKRKDVVGVVIVVNGHLKGFEYFGSNKFFGQALPAIMNGVFNDALIAQNEKSLGKTDVNAAAKFVAKCLSGKNEQSMGDSGDFALYKTEALNHSGVSLRGKAARSGGGAMASETGLMRGSYFSEPK